MSRYIVSSCIHNGYGFDTQANLIVQLGGCGVHSTVAFLKQNKRQQCFGARLALILTNTHNRDVSHKLSDLIV